MAHPLAARRTRASDTHRNIRGMTLIELIAALAVLAIVVGFGFPSLGRAITGTHATVVGNRLLADLALARTEAIMTRSPGVVCPSRDGTTCSGRDDWSEGWIVFVDRNGDNQRSGTEPLLATASGGDIGGNLRVISSVDRTKVRFLPDGRNGGTNLSIHVCDGPRLERDVIVNISGRARIVRSDVDDKACQ